MPLVSDCICPLLNTDNDSLNVFTRYNCFDLTKVCWLQMYLKSNRVLVEKAGQCKNTCYIRVVSTHQVEGHGSAH